MGRLGGGSSAPSGGVSSTRARPEGPTTTRQLAQAIAKLRLTDPERAKDFDQYLGAIPDEDLAAAGIERPEAKKNKSLWGKAKGAVGSALNVLDRPSQAVLGLIENARDDASVGETFGDLGKALSGHGGGDEDEEHLNFRGALGIDPDAGGRWAGALDTLGTIATDPTTYLTFGTSAAAKQAIKVAGKELGADAAQRLTSKGLKALTKTEQATLRQALKDAAPLAKNADKTAAKQMRALGLRAKGGINFGARGRGINVLSGERAGRIARKVRISDTTEDVTRTAGKVSDYRTPLEMSTKLAEVKTKAEQKLIDKAMKPLPKVQAEVDSLRSRANDAIRKAAEIRADISDANLDGFAPRYGDGKRLGQAETRARVLTNLKTSAEARLAKTTADVNQALREVPAKVSEKVAAKEDSLLRSKPLLPATGLPQVTEKVVTKKGVKGGIGRSKVAQALVPRAKIKAVFGEDVAEQVHRGLAVADATHGMKVDEVVQRLSAALKGTRLAEDTIQAIRDALDTGGSLAAAKASLGPEAGHLLDEMDAVRQQVYNDLIGSGLVSADSLRAADEYLLHRLTKQGREWVQENKSRSRALGLADNAVSGNLDMGGSLKRRAIPGNITDKNTRMASETGVEQMFDTNPVGLVAESASRTYRGLAEVDFVKGLAKIDSPTGQPLVLQAPKGDKIAAKAAEVKAKALGYQKIEGDEATNLLGDLWAPPELADEILRARAVVLNDEALVAYRGFLDRWQAIWKGYATLPVVGGVSFFSRNAQSNGFLNYLAGHTDPRLYTEAFKIQRALKKAGAVDEAALRAAGLTERQAKIAMEAKGHGVLGTGFFDIDLPGESTRKLSSLTKGQRAKQALNPVNTDNLLLRPGKKLNAAVENNARLAHFIGALDKLGSVEEAAASVRRYLFDYGDLTKFEREKLKRVIGFYTFMRKNTSLQVSKLLEEPGKFTAATHTVTSLGSGDPKDRALPGYALEAGQMPLAGDVASFLTGKGDVPVLGGPDLPFTAAAETLGPLTQLATFVPGLREILPEGLRPEEGFTEVARHSLNVPAGGSVEALKALVERGTNRDLFTGGTPKTGTKDTLVQLAALVAPLVEKEDRMIPAVADAVNGGDLTAKNRLRLINALLGANVTAVDEATSEGVLRGAKIKVEAALRALRESGEVVPTWSELQKAGVVPERESPASRSEKRGRLGR